MSYYLGLDNGGTNSKAAIFDSNGRQIALESAATPQMTSQPGFVEVDMEALWITNCRIIRRLLAHSGIPAKEISGVGLCGHGKGLYLWGKDDRPVRAGILSSDNRAWSRVAEWEKCGIASEAYEINAQKTLPCQPASLLAWLIEHEPETVGRTRWIFSCKDYVRFRLTGNAYFELSDCSGSGLMDLRRREYSDRLLDLYGIKRFSQALPPVCGSLDVCGGISSAAAERTGLCEGTPVIGGMFDIDACCLASGICDETDMCMIAGTWSINEYLSKTPVLRQNGVVNSLFCLPDYYLIEASSPTSAGNMEWIIRHLLQDICIGTDSVYETLNSWADEFRPEDDVPIFLPFLMGGNSGAPERSAFLGLNISHTRKHLVRAVYEGVTYSHRVHFDDLIAARGAGDGRIRLTGGAARSTVWAQMFADVMGMPVDVADSDETGVLGCCIAVAAALGHYSSLAAAAGNMTRVSCSFKPCLEAHDAYERKYQLFRRMADRLRPLWAEI